MPAPRGNAAGGGGMGITDQRDRERTAALIAQRSHEPGNGGGYRIGPDDLLEIRIPDLLEPNAVATAPRGPDGSVPGVAGAPTFAQGVRVSASGDVGLPLLGQIRADGLTPTDLEGEIARRLVQRGILRQPQVSVAVIEYRSRVVAVVGAVERPGVFPATRPGATVSDLIWAAGGPSKDAGRMVQLVPAAPSPSRDGHPPTDPNAIAARDPIRLDLEALLHAGGAGNGAVAIPVRPGDVISVGPAGAVTVEGWVGKPGSYPVTRGMSLAGAVAAAGGPLFPADRSKARVQRANGDGAQQVLTVDLDAVGRNEATDLVMMDGDVVRLPASTPRLIPWGVWTVAKELVRIGGNVLLF
ncbi:MAG TPA: SLBB domain-containing protein [Candidatus Binatia bacterium]|nr:SLBB domain-containing protein [Candidatus Binatia bacterium]